MAESVPNDLRQYRGWVKIGNGEYLVDINKDGKLEVNDSRSDFSSESGGQKQVFVQDDETRNLLNSILKQQKITNMHLSVLSDNVFKTSDVET